MCGISGLVLKSGQAADRSEISKVNNAAKHRGPDAEDYYLNGRVALGHRRLSIIDLSPESNQPMTADELTIVYNGEIFNYIEIRKELVELGYIFKTDSDTEVILASYNEWGSNCVHKFNGMWAFCIFDPRNELLFCSRDRYGIKPFHYVNNSDRFAFASEIKQLLPLMPEAKADKQVLAEYILGAEDFHERTFFKEVYRLLPGHNLVYSLVDSKLSISRYYTIEKRSFEGGDERIKNTFRNLLFNAVRIRLRSDVEVGTCLSGGLDSSAIAGIAANILSKDSVDKFSAIHAKSIELDTDESQFAISCANYCNLNLSIVEPQRDRFSSVLNEVIQLQDEPFGGPSILMQYFVFEEAAKRRIKVMLDGQGGDELLVGYDSYFSMYITSVGFIRKMFEFFGLKKDVQFKLNIFVTYHLRHLFFHFKKYSYRRMFKELNRDYFDLIDYKKVIMEPLNACKGVLDFQRFQMYRVIQKLLRYEDRNSMVHGIESRLPLLDHELVEFALSIPLHYKLSGDQTKQILREVISELVPEEITERRDKKGFEAPKSFWTVFKEESILDVQESKIIQDMFPSGLPQSLKTSWRIANIARWEKELKVKI